MAYSSPPHQLSRSVPSALASSLQNPGIIGEPSRSRHLASSSEKPPPRNGEFLLQLLQQGGAISNQPSLKNSCLVVESALDNERSAWHIQDPAVAALGPSHPAQQLGDAGTEGNQISAQHLFGWRPPSAISSDFPFPSPVDLSIFLDGSLPSSTDPLFHPPCNHPVKAPADQYPPRQHPFVQFPSNLHSSADLSVFPFVDHSSDSSRSTYGPGTSQHLASPMFSLPTGIPSSQRTLEVTCHPSVSRQGLPGEVGVLPACESGLSNSIRQVLLPHSSFHIHRLEISEGLDFELPTFSNAVLAFNEIQTKESGLAGGELKGPHHGAIGVLKGDECASKTNPGDNVSQLWTSTCPGTQFEEGKPLVSRPGVRYEEVATDSTSRPRFRHLEVSTDSIRRPISCHNEACRVEKSHRFQSGDGHDRAVVEPWLNEWGSTNVELPVHFQESRDKTVLLPRKDTETCDIERGIANLDMCGRSEEGKKFSTLAVEVLAANDMDFIGVNDKELKLEVTRESARHNGIKGDWGYGPPHAESFKKGSIRTATGQWVAVVREREAADAIMKQLVEGDGKLEFSGVSNVGHPETFSLSHDRLIHKTHDDPKKKKGQMQEWRMKQSQATDRLPRPHNDTALNTRSLRSKMNSSQHRSEDKCDFPESCFPSQLDHPGLASTSNLDSAQGIAKEQSKQVLQAFTYTVKDEKARARAERGKSGLYQDCVNEPKGCGQDFKKEEAEDMIRGLGGSLEFNTNDIEVSSASGRKPGMSDTVKTMRDSLRRVGRPLQQAVTRLHRRQLLNRPDLEKLTKEFLGVFQSLIPPEDEEVRRKQLISGLEELIAESWPAAKLFLFGSCANAFGVCNSDIDVCLSLQGEHSSKPELVLRLAEILQGDKMLNVQALTHARVPIVKFTDPTTGISCDICINNMLAVVNTKLLYDYAQIDSRLRQLAFMVKHWAKRRQVNETYRGTLSSYAYVLMCIHFLQQRRPAILPCLQEMEPTYKVTVGKIQCSYYDQVHRLKNFGAKNKETIGELLTSFFEYWAFRHDYSHAVISVRTGGFLSKIEKDWTRRIGNERHLICIEDPFEISHDLGRVVDKHSIGVLREEFQRAAKIMRHDSNPSETLFELYVREEA